jgi:hypothetical protein
MRDRTCAAWTNWPTVTAAYSSRWSRSVDKAYWLPPRGFSNGLDAEAWAPIADVSENEAGLFLRSLRDAGIPAYAARRAGRGLDAPFGIWVGTWHYSRAEDVIARVLLRMRRGDSENPEPG